jgi:magnesium transporter
LKGFNNSSGILLGALPEEEAKSIRFLAAFHRDSAGGLMNTEYLAYREANSVDDVLNDLRRFADDYATYNVQYLYVVSSAEAIDDSDHKGDSEGRLVGVLPLRDLVLAPRGRRISQMMIRNPISVDDSMTLDSLQHLFDSRSLFGLPVVDANDMLVGVVRRSDIQLASEQQAGRTFLRFAGILGGEELRSLPLKTRCGRRLSWLSINIVLNIIAASVISMYEETLSAVIALAVFLPMVSDMSGCSGNQAVAVSTRELVLGVIKPGDYLHVFRKEVLLGLLNGIALGILLGIVAYVWKGTPALGLVVGGALAANTLIAVCLGALIPLLLKGFKVDPALASGPILTTLTDMCGFFLVLSFAQLMLPWLT